MKKYLFIVIIAPILFYSCVTDAKEVRVFFVDQGKLQYFLPSEVWCAEKEKSIYIKTDFLFRSYNLSDEAEARTVFNFTIYSDSSEYLHGNPMNELALCDGDVPVAFPNEAEMLFADRDEVRYTSWLESKDFSEYMNVCKDPVIRIITERQTFHFRPKTNVFQKHMEYFRTVKPAYE